MRKITFSVPDVVVENLDYVSGRIGVSRSSLLSQLLEQPLSDLTGLVKSVPENPTSADVVRFRGNSEALVQERVDSLRSLGNDLLK